VGSPTHLSGERLRFAAGFEALHVPQKGAAAAVTEVIAGRLDYYMSPLVSALSLIRAGKATALAIPAAKRLALLPDVPTTLELGLTQGVFESGVGLWAPRKTSRDIVNRLNRDVAAIAQAPETRALLQSQGAEPWIMTPEQFDAFIRADSQRQQELVKAAGIRPE
jgi:tripartite-type tricarboxylate transporter receptor subunit TctC